MKFWRPDSSETLRIKEGSEDIGDADTNTGGGVGDRGTRVDKSVGEARVVSIVLGELSEVSLPFQSARSCVRRTPSTVSARSLA